VVTSGHVPVCAQFGSSHGFETGEDRLTDGPSDPEMLAESLAHGDGPTTHCCPGADGHVRTGPSGGIFYDRAKIEQPPLFPFGQLPTQLELVRGVNLNRAR
jgi:hypothetical protein